MVHQCHNVTLDDTNRSLGTTSFTNANGVVFNGPTVLDLGALPPGFNINTSSSAPFGRFAVVMDWTGIDISVPSYWISVIGADDAAFSTGVTRLVLQFLGAAASTGHQFDTPPAGREVFYFDNVSIGSAAATQNTKRFLRVQIVHFSGVGTPNLQIAGMWIAPI
jgi:hypothetical protein